MHNIEIDLWPFPELSTEYINGKRVYVTPQGNKYFSVTTILGILSEGSKGLQEWKKRVGEQEAKRIAGIAAKRGDGLHKICENFLLGLDYKKDSNPATLTMFNSLKDILSKNVEKIHGLEFALFSDDLQTAGRVDSLCVWNGTLSILDFKTASRPKQKDHIINYYIQTVCYALMVEEYHQCTIPQVVILIAVEHDFPQIFIEPTDPWRESVRKFFKSRSVNEYKRNLLISK